LTAKEKVRIVDDLIDMSRVDHGLEMAKEISLMKEHTFGNKTGALTPRFACLFS